MSERARKKVNGWIADTITINWPGMDLPGWPPPDSGDREALLELKRQRDVMRAASEVPLSPSGEADEEMTDADVAEVDRRYQEMVASGQLSEQKLKEAFDRRFPSRLEQLTGPPVQLPPDAWSDPPRLVIPPDSPKAEPGPLVGAEEVRPEASRPEEVASRDHSPPQGRGPAAVEGPPPASVSCHDVVAWLNADRSGVEGEQLRAYQDHLHDCASCDGVADLRALEEASRS